MSQEITEQAQDLAAQDSPKEIRSHAGQAQEEAEKEQVRAQLLREEKLVSGFTWIFLFVWIIGCAFLCRSAMSGLVA